MVHQMRGQTAVEYLFLVASVVGLVTLISYFIKKYVLG